MSWFRSRQRAGNDSTQIQAQTVLVITNDTAHEIWDKQQARALAGTYTEEARTLGQQRSQRLGDRVIEQFSREDLLSVFQEPDFQALLTKAQIGAAQTDDEVDYSVLASMLADRARKGNVRKRRIGLDRAIEVADKVDLPALKALTCIFIYSRTHPTGGLIKPNLASQDQIYGMILADETLPAARFMDHLDLLNLVRIQSLGNFKKFNEFLLPRLSGWYAAGRMKSDPDVNEAWAGFRLRGLTPIAEISLAEHELDTERFRLAYASPNALRERLTRLNRYSPLQIDAIMQYAADEFGLTDTGNPTMMPALLSLIDEMPAMGAFKNWFEALPHSFVFTEAGTIMARAYAEHCGVAAKVNNWQALDVE